LADRILQPKQKRRRKAILWTALLLALIPAIQPTAPAHAHPLDMYFFSHEVHLTPERIEVYTTIQPGPMMALSEWYQLDSDMNGKVTPKEITAWGDARMEAFSLAFAGIGELPLTLISVGWPSSAEALQLGDESLRIAVRADWPAAAEQGSAVQRLELHFHYEEARSINWFYLHGEDGVTFGIPEQDNGLLSVELRTSSGVFSPAAGLTYWDSGSPALGSEEDSSTAAIPAGSRSTTAILTGLVRTPELGAAFYLGAVLITLALGAIHALTPGHGKTLAAAYLIGERGTARHAFALGGIVTATHTGSVMIFGLLTLALSQFIIPADFFPYLELLSGLLIVAMAAGLILPRLRGYRSVARARRRASETESQTRPDRATDRRPAKRIAIDQAVESRPYDDLLAGGHRATAAAAGTPRRLLIALGVSGGLVPCPDAVAILLVAVAINRILLGLGLVITFSLGMAAVLILIGLAVVRGRRWLTRFDVFSRIAPVFPLVSAVIILGVGVFMTADVVLRYGLPDTERAGTVQNPPTAQAAPAFDISRAGMLYLASDGDGTMQIHLQSPIGRESRRISSASTGVADFRLSPDGTSIAYASAGEQECGIWILPVTGGEPQCAVDCRDAYCSNVLWTPDGGHLLYERTEANSVSAVPTLWSYALENGTTRTVFRDPRLPGYTASWSPDGAWLSYFSYPGSPVVEIYNRLTGERHSIPSQTGRIASWSPDSASLLVTDMLTSAARPVSHLFRYDLETETLTDLSFSPDVEDYTGAWSPEGGWLAVIRRESTESNPMGTQIWLMQPDGGDAHPITSIPPTFHSGLQWSPDGRYLLIQQQGLEEVFPQSEIGMLDVLTGEYTPLVEGGYLPGWAP
jgi:nickel/cobalt exporter